MAKQQRRFSQALKQEAVPMTRGADLSISHVAKDLGIHTTVFSRWRREQERDGATAFRGQGIPRDDAVARDSSASWLACKRARDCLRDAAVFFARDTPRSLP